MSLIPWTSGRILMREVIFGGYFRNLEPLRIGSGRQSSLTSAVDLAVLRISLRGMDLPYIPGSSLKGCFRSVASALASLKGLDVCSGLAKETCLDLKILDSGRRLGEEIESLMRTNQSAEAMKKFFQHACILCKIFGAPGYIGKVFFEDAYPIDDNGDIMSFRLGTRTGIAIDRRTGAAARGALYTVEYVEPGARFKFRILCKNLPNYALGLLASAMRMVHEGEVKLGGFKTRGFGRVAIEDLKLRIRDFEKPELVDLRALENGVDREVRLSDIARMENGWVVVDGDNAWKALERLEGVWWDAKL